ncbi:MAG: hypothetical protein A2846_04860 [Candidatus Doudnabacteria bacterium RIFCSPHIGHO2_01_FULL_49_9]|uniref:Uncharacterized protein n=1 Tax=Candidatus Doudnabacteria bacterium RIFCSPHIGHO2_01_FULL_49_9 TaxID=1817827 RepID=A0A1F5P433_9BACT|nr:MAG: hypothetical protein A2846_04860 [Candidatus Doudnabacteria bacterium RIFCSPHIGHO2_01_FULL_49_9]
MIVLRNKIGKFVYLGLLIMVLAVQFLPVSVQAQGAVRETGFEDICSRNIGIAVCVKQIYLFSLGAGALITLLMVVLAGYRYMTASGNAEAVSSAKESLESAFKGLIIIFVGFILLYLINPELTQFRNLPLQPIPMSTGTSGGSTSPQTPAPYCDTNVSQCVGGSNQGLLCYDDIDCGTGTSGGSTSPSPQTPASYCDNSVSKCVGGSNQGLLCYDDFECQ